MVQYIKSDLEFILAQIKIAEAHAAGQPLYGAGGLIPHLQPRLGPADGRRLHNHLLPGQEKWGAADQQFPELVDPVFGPADGTCSIRTVARRPGNADHQLQSFEQSQFAGFQFQPAHDLQPAGRPDAGQSRRDPDCAGARRVRRLRWSICAAVTAIYATFKPASDAEYQARVVMQSEPRRMRSATTPPLPGEAIGCAVTPRSTRPRISPAADLEAAREVRDAALEPFGIEMDGDNVHLPNVAPDEGLSAPFNSWFTFFGQFFDHGLDLVDKGGSGTVFIPLQPDDPLYVAGQPRPTSWC